MFRKYTAVERYLKDQILTAVEPVFLSPLVNQLTMAGQVSTLTILQHLFSSYRAIEEIDLDENSVKMMGPYDPVEPLSRLIEQLEKGRELARAGEKTISDSITVFNGITLLEQTVVFYDDIQEWRHRTTE